MLSARVYVWEHRCVEGGCRCVWLCGRWGVAGGSACMTHLVLAAGREVRSYTPFPSPGLRVGEGILLPPSGTTAKQSWGRGITGGGGQQQTPELRACGGSPSGRCPHTGSQPSSADRLLRGGPGWKTDPPATLRSALCVCAWGGGNGAAPALPSNPPPWPSHTLLGPSHGPHLP